MTILQSVLPICPFTRICPSLINGSHIYMYVLHAYQAMKFAYLLDVLIQNKALHKQKHELHGLVSIGDMQ